ncbi:MATE family efflux transporter [Cellulosilyticum ruminicola]
MFITCQGQAKIAMLSVLIGAVINIILDPIFIFIMHLGVKEATLATVISQCCSAIWVIKSSSPLIITPSISVQSLHFN